MAYEISDLDGVVVAPGGDYQYGSVKNKPLGTRVNVKMVTDLLQMAQRMMANAGVSPNGDPDNDANGYQLVEAIVTIAMRGHHGMAEMFGAETSSTVPVRISGMAASIGAGPVLNVTAGWGYWWGKYFYYPGGSTPYTDTQKMTISFVDTFPVAALSTVVSVTPSATEFEFDDMVDWRVAVGLDVEPWIAVTANTGWAASAPTPEYTRAGMKTCLRGVVTSSSSSPAAKVTTLPVGYRPPADVAKVLPLMDAGGGGHAVVVTIRDTGEVEFLDAAQLPTAVAWFLFLDFEFVRDF